MHTILTTVHSPILYAVIENNGIQYYLYHVILLNQLLEIVTTCMHIINYSLLYMY